MIKVILAGILALPCFLVILVTAPIIAILAIPSLYLLIYRQQQQQPSSSSSSSKFIPDHVIIVGGSSGIGKSIAQECVKQGIPKITILARNKDKLQATKDGLIQNYGTMESSSSTSTKSQINTHSVSVSDYTSLQKVAFEILGKNNDKENKDTKNNQNQHQRIVLFNCAGIPYTTEFEQVPVEQYETLVQTNQLGAMYVVRAFLPYLQQGTIVLCSSAAAQVGVYGYSIYSPTKYALRGFAETLHAELIRSKPNVAIQIAFPADTNTPGYEEESKMMPAITKALNETAGLANPDDTAKVMIQSAFCTNPKFAVYFGLEGWMLANLTAGMGPVSSLGDAMAQVALSGVFRFISLFVLNDWWTIIRNFPTNNNNKDNNDNDTKSKPKDEPKKGD